MVQKIIAFIKRKYVALLKHIKNLLKKSKEPCLYYTDTNGVIMTINLDEFNRALDFSVTANNEINRFLGLYETSAYVASDDIERLKQTFDKNSRAKLDLGQTFKQVQSKQEATTLPDAERFLEKIAYLTKSIEDGSTELLRLINRLETLYESGKYEDADIAAVQDLGKSLFGLASITTFIVNYNDFLTLQLKMAILKCN